jgi:hypothetical protein
MKPQTAEQDLPVTIETSAVAVRQSGALSRPAPTPADMMQTMIEKGVTQENVAAFAELVKLSEHMEDRKLKRDSESAFNASFVRVQREMPNIKADKAVEQNGKVLYTYCSYEEIWQQVQPILSSNGFSVRYSQDEKDGRLTTTCHLMHEGGLTVSNSYTVRSGKGAPGMNETKCDAAASTIAQREALCDALNIIRRARDNDPRMEGGPVTKEQAFELERRAKEVNANIDAFLKFAGAKTFAEIPSVKYDVLDELLRKKEKK